MQSLFFDCCYPSGLAEGPNFHHIENMRELARIHHGDRRMMDPPPLSPKDLDARENKFGTPPRPRPSDPQCPGAPRKKPRDTTYQEEEVYPAAYASVPLFPFEDFERVDSMDSTFTVPPTRLEPKFTEPMLVEELHTFPTNIIKPDEEREPDEEQDEMRENQHDSEEPRTT